LCDSFNVIVKLQRLKQNPPLHYPAKAKYIC